jgi:hypothetical protein
MIRIDKLAFFLFQLHFIHQIIFFLSLSIYLSLSHQKALLLLQSGMLQLFHFFASLSALFTFAVSSKRGRQGGGEARLTNIFFVFAEALSH